MSASSHDHQGLQSTVVLHVKKSRKLARWTRPRDQPYVVARLNNRERATAPSKPPVSKLLSSEVLDVFQPSWDEELHLPAPVDGKGSLVKVSCYVTRTQDGLACEKCLGQGTINLRSAMRNGKQAGWVPLTDPHSNKKRGAVFIETTYYPPAPASSTSGAIRLAQLKNSPAPSRDHASPYPTIKTPAAPRSRPRLLSDVDGDEMHALMALPLTRRFTPEKLAERYPKLGIRTETERYTYRVCVSGEETDEEEAAPLPDVEELPFSAPFEKSAKDDGITSSALLAPSRSNSADSVDSALDSPPWISRHVKTPSYSSASDSLLTQGVESPGASKWIRRHVKAPSQDSTSSEASSSSSSSDSIPWGRSRKVYWRESLSPASETHSIEVVRLPMLV